MSAAALICTQQERDGEMRDGEEWQKGDNGSGGVHILIILNSPFALKLLRDLFHFALC